MARFLNQFFDWNTVQNKIIIFIFFINIVFVALPNEFKKCLFLDHSMVDFRKYSLNIFLLTLIILLITFIKYKLNVRSRDKEKRYYNYGRIKYRFIKPYAKIKLKKI